MFFLHRIERVGGSRASSSGVKGRLVKKLSGGFIAEKELTNVAVNSKGTYCLLSQKHPNIKSFEYKLKRSWNPCNES